VSAGESSSRGPLKASENGVTRASWPYFVGALQYTIDEYGAISAEAWNECIATARELAAERPTNDGA
jgi:hypothetical protein